MTTRRTLLILAGAAVMPLPRLSRARELTMASIPDDVSAALLEQARTRGRLPVIVGLAVPPPENAGPVPDEAVEKAAIDMVRAQLLRDLGVVAGADGTLTGPGITNVKLFDAIPFLALTAEPEALARLLRHPAVTSVQEDATMAPL
jgi:hypothetical protein